MNTLIQGSSIVSDLPKERNSYVSIQQFATGLRMGEVAARSRRSHSRTYFQLYRRLHKEVAAVWKTKRRKNRPRVGY